MVTQWGPSAPTAAPPPLFGPCLYCGRGHIVAKRLPISATAELLFNVLIQWSIQGFETGDHIWDLGPRSQRGQGKEPLVGS